jgi:hypothetical protein
MKKILLVGCLILSSFASELVIKKADVLGSINGKVIAFNKGENLILTEGTHVCYVSGEGRLVINKKTQLFSKTKKKCYQLPIPKGFDLKSYKDKATEMFVVAFIDSKDEIKNGVSTKGSKEFDSKGNIILSSKDKELVIFSKEFGPHPITVNIKNSEGKILNTFVNEENDITFFKVDSSTVKTGYKLEVLSGFDEVLINKSIIKE